MAQFSVQQAFDLAVQHHQAGRLAEAENLYRQILLQQPAHFDALNLLGVIALQAGQLDVAADLMRRAIAVRPDYAEAHSNLGKALKGQGQLNDAIAAYRRAIALNPSLPAAHNNLGNALRDAGRLDEAIAAMRQAIVLAPNFPEAHFNLGNTLRDEGLLDEAIAELRQAIALKPDFADAHSNLVFALHYHAGFDAKTVAEEHFRWGRQHARPLSRFMQPHGNSRDPDRRLRIAYVSADFREHSVSFFLLPLFAQHDRGVNQIICYSDVRNEDAITNQLRACADEWHKTAGFTDERLADKIRQDQIDILIDLAGHTSRNRLRVFARKPAPVQVSYLGYPGTTGLAEIDYRLSDSLADPTGTTESLHAEKLWRLPVCNWCYGAPPNAPPARSSRADAPVCFGTFNNFLKASPAVMEMWAAILKAAPSSRLIIKSGGLLEPSAGRRVIEFFTSRGVQPDRLDLRGVDPDFRSHLDAYNQMDIALDTFPYHGTTTTCEALWMGVPVVTLAGPSHVSRVGVSLLSAVGLPELIAHTPQQYVQIAVALASDLPRLAELRRTLRDRMRASPLMDAPRFARDIEAAYRQLWHLWCKTAAGV
jgi:protein O-GlcNAc transferase